MASYLLGGRILEASQVLRKKELAQRILAKG